MWRSNAVALAELDGLAELPRSWDADNDPESAIARAEARQQAELLRRSLWDAVQAATWLRLPSRIGHVASVGNPGRNHPPQATNGWPLHNLSPAALDGLNALYCTAWSLLSARQMAAM